MGKHGHKTAPEICKALKLPRTEIYYLLTTLQNKGIVSATFQHPIRFSAIPLDKALWTDSASMIYLLKLLFNYIWTTSESIYPLATNDLTE
ncbi:MAG: helix-turn-helix domain-containing protein [Nitrosopumilaceae archaeon]